MNVYEDNQNILFNNIKELLNDSIYQNIKYELNNLIKENNTSNDINKIKEIIKLIKQPQQLLNKDENIRLSFCNSPETTHPIFVPLLSNLISIDDIIKTIDDSTELYKQLKEQFKIYSESQNAFCPQLVGKLNQSSIEEPLQYLDELPLCFNEKFEKFEVKSIKLAYNIASYDPVQYNYTKKNESGNSIGTVVNNVYFKYDKGGQLLKPAKEFAIYQLYKDLFPLSSSTFVSPTQLIVLDNLKILNEDSPILKKLGSLKTQYNQQNVETILEKQPEFRTELINALEKYQPFFIQSSLFVKGQTFQKLLIDHQEQSNQDFNFEQIDMESYSTHIIASLLVIHSDYKPDNLILEDGTNRIVGIDNDESLCDNEINGNKTQIRNILFTFKTLMDKPIHQSVKDQFIKHDPYIFIFKWLLQLESKQIEYEQLIQTIYEFKIFNDENEKQIILKNQNSEINLPLIFRKNWISSMLDRFKEIKNLLEYVESINHQELFQFIHPTSNSYYEYLSNKHPNKPLNIIEDVYFSPINDDLIDKNQNNKEEKYQSNIKESILELIKSKIYDENEDLEIFNEWMFLVFEYLKVNQIEDFQFHQSWYLNNIGIFFKILKYSFSKDILESIISKLNITDIYQVFSYIIHNLSNHNVCDNIEFLITKFKMDIEDLEKDESLINAKSLLDMALNFDDQKGNFKLFLAFLKHGSNKSIDEIKFNNFYQSLSHEEKLELKPYLTKLFNINNKINWRASINQLFPKTKDLSNQNNNSKILKTISGDNRIISDEYWNQLFSSEDTGSLVFISDEYGNGIYVKFYPRFPGTEIAINKLSELLFGFLTPICELASIDNIPILLIQQIPGDTLFDALKKDQDIINKIEPSNLSKQLVFAMISNNGDGNLANFIVVPNDNKSYKIYSIDNDQSFMPSVSKRIGYIKKSLQVSTVLLLFKQMNDKVHQDVTNCVKDLNIYDILNKWLIYLKPQYDLVISHFKTNKIVINNETIIGLSFQDGMISQIYSKLQSLKQILNKSKSITHLNILEIIEPLVGDIYKPVISSNLSITEKYNKLKDIISYFKKLKTSSIYKSVHVLESRTIQNTSTIHNQLMNCKYGPSQALYELKSIKNHILDSEKLIDRIRNIDTQNQVSKKDLEYFLKSNYIEINEKSILNKLYELIKLKEPSAIYLRNNYDLNNFIINQFNIESMVKLDLSGCNMLESMENYSLIKMKTKISFKCLTKLKLKNCHKLNSIRINAPVLKSLYVIHCNQLKNIEVEIPNIEYINLKGSVSKLNIDILKILESFKKIEYLNLSETDYETLTISLENLKVLDISSMEKLKEIYFETPSIESINFEGCHKLKEVKSLKNDYNINSNLLKILYNPELVFNFMVRVYVQTLTFSDFFNRPLSPGTIPSSVQSLTFGRCFYQPLSPGTIPSSVQSLTFGEWFNQPLLPGIIPSSVQSLTFGDWFDQPLSPGIIPPNVQSLTFGYNFNQPLSPGDIPPNVQSLMFGYRFDQPLSRGTIPSSVRILTFGDCFNQPLLPDVIPPNVQSLTFGYGFEQPLSPSTIPSSVQSLTFDNNIFKITPINNIEENNIKNI